MGQKTYTVSINNYSLTLNGTTAVTGSISWSAPELPAGASSWDSVVLTGTSSYSGQGGINVLSISGTSVTPLASFTVDLAKTATSAAISITGRNKNSTGTATLSSLVVTYTCTTAGTGLWLKDNSTWVEASSVYKKINGSWVLQEDLEPIFDPTIKYVRKN